MVVRPQPKEVVMRHMYRLPEECFSNYIVFRSHQVEENEDKVLVGFRRLVCELFNDGQHVYRREIHHGEPTLYFRWLPFASARPLVTSYRSEFANLAREEKTEICIDGHLGTTVLVMFRYFRKFRPGYIEQYLVIREMQSVRVEFSISKKMKKLLFVSTRVC